MVMCVIVLLAVLCLIICVIVSHQMDENGSKTWRDISSASNLARRIRNRGNSRGGNGDEAAASDQDNIFHRILYDGDHSSGDDDAAIMAAALHELSDSDETSCGERHKFDSAAALERRRNSSRRKSRSKVALVVKRTKLVPVRVSLDGSHDDSDADTCRSDDGCPHCGYDVELAVRDDNQPHALVCGNEQCRRVLRGECLYCRRMGRVAETHCRKCHKVLVALLHDAAPQRDDCPICLELMNDDSVPLKELSCSHVFHRSCIYNWFCVDPKRHTRCPICKLKQKKDYSHQ